jgi:hypothetical protein
VNIIVRTLFNPLKTETTSLNPYKLNRDVLCLFELILSSLGHNNIKISGACTQWRRKHFDIGVAKIFVKGVEKLGSKKNSLLFSAE